MKPTGHFLHIGHGPFFGAKQSTGRLGTLDVLPPLLGHTLLQRNMPIGAKITVVLKLKQAKRKAVKYHG